MYKHVLAVFVFSIFFQSYFHNNAYCDNRLFLQKSINYTEGRIYLADILSITGNSEELDKIRNIIIPADLYSDGYVDRKEITILLRKHTKEIYLIYGNSVRLIDPLNNIYSDIDSKELLVKEGDKINLIVKKNGINIEMQGIVMEDGKIEDEINVKLLNRSGRVQKIVKGRVKSKELVEAAL